MADRLTIELVPETAWYSNLRKKMKQSQWNKLRKQVYAQYSDRCGVCGAEGRLNCHEIWLYDDEQHIQTLEGFIALCDMCHFVKHLGLAGILARQGKLDYDAVVQHFMEVNDCSREEFEKRRDAAFKQWQHRSGHEWVTDLGDYAEMIET